MKTYLGNKKIFFFEHFFVPAKKNLHKIIFSSGKNIFFCLGKIFLAMKYFVLCHKIFIYFWPFSTSTLNTAYRVKMFVLLHFEIVYLTVLYFQSSFSLCDYIFQLIFVSYIKHFFYYVCNCICHLFYIDSILWQLFFQILVLATKLTMKIPNLMKVPNLQASILVFHTQVGKWLPLVF